MSVEPRAFFVERMPERVNELLAGEVAEGLAVLRELEATLRWDIQGEGGGSFYLNFAAGQLVGGETAARAPVLTFVQERPHFERLIATVGDAPLAPLALLGGGRTPGRGSLERLAGLDATLEVHVTGDTGFVLAVHFAPAPREVAAETRIRLDTQTFDAVRSGALEPQQAFLSGRVALEGDLGLAMRIALTAL